MAETKNFLSLTGLQSYDAKIKALIKSQGKDVTDKLIALIGASEKGADAKTILARVADLETAVGDMSQLPAEVQNLVAAILGESTRAKAAEEALGNRLNVIEGESEGSIKKALADAKEYTDTKNTAMDSRVGALETAIGKGGSVAEKINTAIGGLDADITSAAVEAGKGIQVQVVEADGKVTGVNVTGNFDNKYDALGAAATVNSALETYKGTNDAAVAAAKKAGDDAQRDVDALEAKVGTVAEGKTVVQMISEAQTAATYDDTQVKTDISGLTTRLGTAEEEIDTLQTKMGAVEAKTAANESAINALKGEGDGSVKKQIDAALNDFATKISNDGVVNTYKELVDYCATHSADAAKMAGDISKNATAIAKLETFIGALPEGTSAATVIAYINEKVATETTRAEGVENGIDTRLGAVEAKLGNGEGSVDAKIEAAKNEAISTATTKADNALNDAKSYVDGKLGNIGEEKGTVTARIKAIEDELAAAVTFEAISEEQINALFENK